MLYLKKMFYPIVPTGPIVLIIHVRVRVRVHVHVHVNGHVHVHIQAGYILVFAASGTLGPKPIP